MTKQFFIAASPRGINSLSALTLQVGDTTIWPSNTVKNLGVIFDSSMSMSYHVTSVCKSLNFHLRNLNCFRKYIDQQSCHHAVRSVIISRLDYCNSLLYGVSQGGSTGSRNYKIGLLGLYSQSAVSQMLQNSCNNYTGYQSNIASCLNYF